MQKQNQKNNRKNKKERAKVVSIYLLPKEKQAVENLAKANLIPISLFIRRILLKRISGALKNE